MKYDLVISENIAKDVYSLHAFDAEWSGPERALDRVILYLHNQAIGRAMAVCNDVVDTEDRKSFDRGYVKGLYEAMMFLKKASTTGRLLQFPDEKNSETPPKIV
jgi:hypothetical protein